MDEFVLSQLSPKEKIEHRHEAAGITWFATNKRVLRFKRSFFGDRSLHDLDYRHIVSINLEEKRYLWLLVVSAFILILGFFTNHPTWIILTTITATLVGVVAIFYRISYYQFRASSIKLKNWKIRNTRTKEGRGFVQGVRHHCFFGGKKK